MAECFALVQGRRMRVTRLDECGNFPDPDTECSFVVSSGFVTVSLSAELEDGTDIVQLNAAGELCVNQRSVDQLRHFSVEIEFCEVDPELLEMVTHARIVEDGAGEGVGVRFPTGGSTTGYALEVWAGVDGQECPPDAEAILGYLLLPWVVPGAPGDVEIANDTITFTVNGFTKVGGGWGVGPYDVVEDDTSAPSPLLTPIASDEPFHMQLTTIDAPPAECGCQAMPTVV